eukprot:8651341-Lingulodinium_polyedra.AAC.1
MTMFVQDFPLLLPVKNCLDRSGMLDILSAKTSSFSDCSSNLCLITRRRLRNDSSLKNKSYTATSKSPPPPSSSFKTLVKNCLKLATSPGFPWSGR